MKHRRPLPPAPPPAQEWGTPEEARALRRISRATLYRLPKHEAPWVPNGKRGRLYNLAAMRRFLYLNQEA